ncbi:hypothetical protein OYC64_017374 [Pagothenia borchgrevinki]|uniref:Uncharacterized protein n=1 Tax=Pagothenia borchgrevinki TaxID=8213 RepID=A0ABD2HM68_PAGBO
MVNESLRGDQMVQFTKAQETEDKMLTSMERQAEVFKQQMERQQHQDEVWALRQEEASAQRARQEEASAQRELRQERQDERQTAFHNGFLEVLSQLVKANRSSSL